MRNIFSRFWAFYSLFVLGFLLLIAVPIWAIILFLFGKKSERFILISGYHYVARLLLFLIGIRITRKIEGVFSKEPFVLVSNHRSMLDVMVSEVSCPVPFKFLGKKEIERLPLMGWLAKNLSLSVDRKDEASRAKSMELLEASLAEGMSVFIFPEGTRNRTEKPLKPFYQGAFRLAKKTGRPMMVQTLIDTEKLVASHLAFAVSPGRVTSIWQGPIYPEEYTNEAELQEKIKDMMMQNIEGIKEQKL